MGFIDPVVGGTILRIPAVQSPNFSLANQTGWAIMQDGSAYFFNVTATGIITATAFQGTNFTIDAAGIFFYSGAPAAGNLLIAIANTAGADPYGNVYAQGANFISGSRQLVMGETGGSPLIYGGTGNTNITNSGALQATLQGSGTGQYDIWQLLGPEDSTRKDWALVQLVSSSADATQVAELSLIYVDTGGVAHPYLIINSAGVNISGTLTTTANINTSANISSRPSAAGNTLFSGNVNATDSFDRLRILVNSIAMGPGSTARDVQLARTGIGLLVVSNPATANALTLAVAGNLAVGGSAGLGDNGVGELQLTNAATVPTTNPTGGAILYANQGVPTVRDTGGNLLGMVRSYYKRSTSDLASFTTEADVTGATQTVVITGSNATVLVTGTFDMEAGTSACTMVGFFNWNGSDQSEQAIFTATAAGQRATINQTWQITGVTAGSYTAKFRASCTASGAANAVKATHTGFTVLVIDQ